MDAQERKPYLVNKHALKQSDFSAEIQTIDKQGSPHYGVGSNEDLLVVGLQTTEDQ